MRTVLHFHAGLIILFSLGFLLNSTICVAADNKSLIRVSTEKNSLLLGVETSLEVTMHLPKNSELHKFNFQALYGTVKDVEEMKTGRSVRATYIPPQQFFPSVDMIVVSASDGEQTHWGFTMLKLYGQGKAKIMTAPNATTHVRIGNKKFGPVTADANGAAFVDVEVPPGITHGIDDEGNEVPLHLPKSDVAAIFAARGPQINIDDTTQEDLLLVFWTPEGNVDPGISNPVVQADLGQVYNAEPILDGVFKLRYDVHTAPGLVTFSVLSEDEQLIHTQKIELVSTENFSETAVTIKEEPKKKPQPPKPPPVKKVVPKVIPRSEYLFFASARTGLELSLPEWFSPTLLLDFSMRLPTKPLLGVGLQTGVTYNSKSENKLIGSNEKTKTVSRMVMIPVEAKFWYRLPVFADWYLSPSAAAGILIVRNKIELKGLPVEPSTWDATFVGGISAAVERNLGPGMVVGEVSGTYRFSRFLKGVDDNQFAVIVLVGYRLAFLKPRH
ncbi:MAG: hypothetical protein JXR76_27020 [Deltaproteobacteria bacterium]|nr:hypothetical protein [Deltaproteobacteria bacterium]